MLDHSSLFELLPSAVYSSSEVHPPSFFHLPGVDGPISGVPAHFRPSSPPFLFLMFFKGQFPLVPLPQHPFVTHSTAVLRPVALKDSTGFLFSSKPLFQVLLFFGL